MTASSGRRLAFAIYVNNVGTENVNGALQVGNDLGSISEAIYEANWPLKILVRRYLYRR